MGVLTKDRLFEFQWILDAKFSPDGESAVYVVSHIEQKDPDKGRTEDKEFTTLYLVDIASGQSRKMTSGKYRDASPAWSPDGKTIAFVSTRDDTPQIYLLPVDGGEAQQLTEMKQGASNPAWSPDGTKIAFSAGIDWGDNRPDRSKDPYTVKRNVWRFDNIGDLDLAVNNLYVVDVDGGDPKQLTDTPTLASGFRWSLDGDMLLFGAFMHPDSFKAMFMTLHTVDMDGNITDVVPRDWGYLGEGYYTPDGSIILFVGRPDDGRPIGTHSDLMAVNVADGSISNRTPGMELAIGGGLEGRAPAMLPIRMVVDKDGTYAYHRVQVGGCVEIQRFALSGEPEVKTLVSGERTCILMDVSETHLLYFVDDVNTPYNLYISDLDGGNERQLTTLNADIMAEVDPMEVVTLQFKGSDGADVEGWFVKPTIGEAPYPTLLWIHGGPHGAQGNHFAFDTWALAAEGFAVMYVNHRASTGYGDAFATAIKGDWGNLDYNDLMAGVDDAIAKGLADADNLGVYGISGGGNLSCWTIGNTNRFKAAIPQNPVTNWVSFYGVSDIGVWFGLEELGGHPHEIPEIYSKCSPITYAHKCTTPTLMIQNEHDWRCPPEQSEQFYTVLKANGCIVDMLRHPANSHVGSIAGTLPARKSHIEETVKWFNKYILGKEAAEDEDDTEEAEAEKSAV